MTTFYKQLIGTLIVLGSLCGVGYTISRQSIPDPSVGTTQSPQPTPDVAQVSQATPPQEPSVSHNVAGATPTPAPYLDPHAYDVQYTPVQVKIAPINVAPTTPRHTPISVPVVVWPTNQATTCHLAGCD